MENNELQKKQAELVAKAWSDPEFKKKLLADPKKTIKEASGFDFSGEIIIHENTSDKLHLVLPQKPEGNVDLDKDVSAGAC